MSNQTPATCKRSTTPIKGRTLRAMILRNVRQQRAAIEHGDHELAELFARCTTHMLDEHLHGAAFRR